MNYLEIANTIKSSVGGSENILNVTHCATRLRLVLKDSDQFNEEEIKNIEGVVNTIKIGDEFQIIIGNDVKYIYNAFIDNDKKLEKIVSVKKKNSIKTLFFSFTAYIQASIGAIIPLMVGTGLIKAGLILCLQIGILSEASDTYQLLLAVADSFFYFMGVIAAIGAARKLNADIPMAVFMALMFFAPGFIARVAEGTDMNIFGIPVYSVSYANQFLPIIMSVWVMNKLDIFLNTYLPDSIKDIFRPTLLILIMIPLNYCILGPSVTWLAYLLAEPFTAFINYPWVLTTLFGLLMPVLVMFGVHGLFFTVVSLNLFSQVGYDPFLMPGGFCSFFAIVAVSLMVGLKAKDSKTKSQSISTALTLFLGGVSEPAIFTVLINNKKVMGISMLSGAIGGLIAGILSVKCFMPVGGSLLMVPYYVGEGSPLSNVLIAVSITSIIAFVLTFVLYKSEDKVVKEI